jgi:hypothetical protein
LFHRPVATASSSIPKLAQAQNWGTCEAIIAALRGADYVTRESAIGANALEINETLARTWHRPNYLQIETPMTSQNLHFIRGTATFDPQTCFETWTDVWVFGDVRGYEYTRSMILNGKGTKKAIRLDQISRASHSMRVTILPAERHSSNRSRVKLVERLIWDRDRLNMELVIYGNPAGYDRLAAVFQQAVEECGDPSSHWHVDDSPARGRWVLPRSVSLNVHRPLSNWNLESLGTFKTIVTDRQEAFLPEARLIPTTPERYEPISPDDCTRLRLV